GLVPAAPAANSASEVRRYARKVRSFASENRASGSRPSRSARNTPVPPLAGPQIRRRQRYSGQGRQDGRMRVLIAPDSFKGTLGAAGVARALAAGWRPARPADSGVEPPLP